LNDHGAVSAAPADPVEGFGGLVVDAAGVSAGAVVPPLAAGCADGLVA